MKNVHPSSPCARQRGMGLVELMIGMAIGLVLLIALGYFFLGSRQANRTHDDISRMQESGRHALEILGSAIRQAGYRADASKAFVIAYPGSMPLTGTDSATDTITAAFSAQEGGETDCGGTFINAVPTVSPPADLVTFAFAVNGSLQLTCNGQPVADNIEDLQIEYGIDSDKNGAIESYQNAGAVADFSQVAAVRVHLLVRGPSTNAASGSQTYTFNGADVTRTDGFLRQVYTATFAVRNQAG